VTIQYSLPGVGVVKLHNHHRTPKEQILYANNHTYRKSSLLKLDCYKIVHVTYLIQILLNCTMYIVHCTMYIVQCTLYMSTGFVKFASFVVLLSCAR